MRNKTLAFLWICVVFVTTLGTAWARDIFVNNRSGNNRYDGLQSDGTTGQDGPVATIARALKLASVGDRIVVANTGQPYRESLTLMGSRHSGGATPFTLLGNGAVLDGSTAIPAKSWEYRQGRVYRFQPIRGDAQQLFLNDKPATLVVSAANAKAPPSLESLQWCFHAGWIYFCAEPQKDPADYRLSFANLPVGITLYHVRRVMIRDLVVQGFHQDGINAFNSCEPIWLYDITCRGNGRAGVVVGGASQVELGGCTLGNNGQAQLLTLPLSETYIEKSQLLSNTAPAWVDQGGRVFLDDREIRGGIDAFGAGKAATPAGTTPPGNPAAQPPAKAGSQADKK